MLAYAKRIDGKNLVFWFQVSRSGWDDYAGSQFVVEFQLSESEKPGAVGGFRQRLPHFLTESELARVRQMQNAVIASLPQPPRGHAALLMGEQIATWYLRKFAPVSEVYHSKIDIWFRYHQPDHVKSWAEFVASVLPRITAEIANKESSAGSAPSGGKGER